MHDEWDDDAAEDRNARPLDVALAIKLLGGCVAFDLVKLYELGSRFGHIGWFRPAVLLTWAALLALTWKGNSWARTMVMVAIAWDILSTISAAGILFAIGGSRLLGLLSWANLGVELCAAYLLLQSESLDWFRKQS